MIHIFIGTKAQLIKMAPVLQEMNSRDITYNFIFSGQHKETIADLLEDYQLRKPDISLYTGNDITSIGKMIRWGIMILAKTIRDKEDIFKGDKSGVIVNHGDTFSTLLGSVIGKINGIKTAHVESGLTSKNILHPFPEELFRRIVFYLSDIYFCPGNWAVENLKGHRGLKIDTKTNTLYDAVSRKAENPGNNSIIPKSSYGIVSLHRYENIFKQKRLTEIITQIEEAAEDLPLLFILHKPTLERLQESNLLDRLENNPNIETRPRYNHTDFMALIKKSEFVITDGGSNQEECFYLGIPCLIMRKHTERQEGLGENAVLSQYKLNTLRNFIKNRASYRRDLRKSAFSASAIIVDNLIEYTDQANEQR
jgi:UDP-N-acetylglucosamine 2-epimerase (non-hydrolysing)